MATADLAEINRRTWDQAVPVYARLQDLLVPERIILEQLAPALQGRAVLDLGVGAGRTTPHLRGMGISRYVGCDVSPGMVAAARGRYPDAEYLVLDACDLSRFDANTFGLVFFSYNGIDYVGHESRMRILSEAFRVLEPGGAFVFCTHNLAYQLARNGGRDPLARRMELPAFAPTLHPLKLARRTLRFAISLAQSLANRARLGRLQEIGDGYAIVNDAGENYACLTYYTTISGQRDQLRRTGFDEVTAIGLDGRFATDACGDYWMHYVARKPR
jgi:SAM-dependent methyltransferase